MDSGNRPASQPASVQPIPPLPALPAARPVVQSAFALLGLRLPEPLARTVGLLGSASSPLALFMIGGTLVGLKLQGVRADLLRVTFGKLVLHPLAVLLAVLALPPFDPVLRTAVVLVAAMPMMGIYPVLAQRFGEDRFGAAALLAATLTSFLTINLALFALRLQPGWLPG